MTAINTLLRSFLKVKLLLHEVDEIATTCYSRNFHERWMRKCCIFIFCCCFQASIVVLWDVLVVNNWFVFLNAYNKTMNTR